MRAPAIDRDSAPWWDGLRAHRVVVQECRVCTRRWLPRTPACPYCGAGTPNDQPVSGTGVVATGVVWPDGHAALRWKADDHDAASSTSAWTSVADLLRVHGHDGLSEIIYLDDDDAPPRSGVPAHARGRVTEPWAWPSR